MAARECYAKSGQPLLESTLSFSAKTVSVATNFETGVVVLHASQLPLLCLYPILLIIKTHDWSITR